MKLNEKVAIITGSGSGIAKAVAFEFIKEGAKVVFSDINESALKTISNELKGKKDCFITQKTDVNKKGDIETMVDAAIKKFGTVDILVNHVGDARLKPFIELTDEDFDFAVNLTLRSTIWCTKAVLPIMQKNMSGKIINTSSIAGKVGMPNASHLCVVKHGIIGLTKSIALEYGKYGINVNAVCPALLETESAIERLVPSFDFFKKIIVSNAPLARLTTPEEISKLYVFLATADSDFMTGQAINFTGGFEMR